jgi:hypothetical protein
MVETLNLSENYNLVYTSFSLPFQLANITSHQPNEVINRRTDTRLLSSPHLNLSHTPPHVYDVADIYQIEHPPATKLRNKLQCTNQPRFYCPKLTFQHRNNKLFWAVVWFANDVTTN